VDDINGLPLGNDAHATLEALPKTEIKQVGNESSAQWPKTGINAAVRAR
jgi:hypothetical protein